MWFFKKKNKDKFIQKTNNLKVSNAFEYILSSNNNLKYHFEDLMKRFEERMWTPEVCTLFKKLAEDLFLAYGIKTTFHVNSNTSGVGSFTVEVHSDK